MVVLLALLLAVCTEGIRFPIDTGLFLFVCLFCLTDIIPRFFCQREGRIFGALRGCPIVLYFFAGFHKLNTDFLFNPGVSCASWFVRHKILLGSLLDVPGATEFFTATPLLLELGAASFLLVPRMRGAGLVMILLLHSILAMGGFILFSFICLVLLISYLSEQRFAAGRGERAIRWCALFSFGYLFFSLPIFRFLGMGGVPFMRPSYFLVSVAAILFVLHSSPRGKVPLLQRGGCPIGKGGGFC